MSKIEQLKEFLNENPKDSFLQFALALEYIKIKSFDAALEIFQELVRDDPQYLATYLHYGNLLAETGDANKAEIIFQMGITLAAAQNKIKAKQELEQAMFLLD